MSMARRRVVKVGRSAVYLFIALSLSVTYYFNCYMLVTLEAPPRLSEKAFKSFSNSFEQYKPDLQPAWRSRIFSNFLGGTIVPLNAGREILVKRIGMWNAIWLLVCFLAYLFWDSRHSLILMFGTFAALYYSFTPITGLRIYPWDMPAVFLFVMIYIAFTKKRLWLLCATVLVGVGFKETVTLGSLALLFWENTSLRRRMLYFLLMIGACVILKISIDLLVESPHLGLTMSFDNEGPVSFATGLPGGIISNLRTWIMVHANHTIFVNAGTFVVFLLLPISDRQDLMWKIVGILFLLGNMFCGIITEHRIFHEIIPISLWAIIKKVELWQSEY